MWISGIRKPSGHVAADRKANKVGEDENSWLAKSLRPYMYRGAAQDTVTDMHTTVHAPRTKDHAFFIYAQ